MKQYRQQQQQQQRTYITHNTLNILLRVVLVSASVALAVIGDDFTSYAIATIVATMALISE